MADMTRRKFFKMTMATAVATAAGNEKMLLRAIDFETSGEEPDIDIVEIGYCDLILVDESTRSLSDSFSYVVNSGYPITPESSSIHHLVDADVANGLKPDVAVARLLDVPSDTILVAHSAEYEQNILGGKRGFRWIDTWKVALHLAPNAPSHKLQVLRYWLKLDVDREIASPAHRAGPDAYVCAALLLRMLTKLTPEQMVEISDKPAFLPRLNFGKHAKLPIAEVPASYLTWVLNQLNEETGAHAFDGNVIYTVITELERRQKNIRG